MPYFQSDAEVYEFVGKLFVDLLDDDELAPKLKQAKGPVAKILKLVPLVKPVFPRYKARLEAAGRDDLASVA